MPQILSITRFFCGCVYHTPGDTAVFCPKHRHTDHRGFITGTDTIEVTTRQDPFSKTPATSVYFHKRPDVLHNTPYNSLHTTTSILDGRNEEWAIPDADLLGICPACFIDAEDLLETVIAACECGDENCSYRWCGSLQGYHAMWRLHANGKSKETIGVNETDLFSFGPYEDQPEHIQQTLDNERETIRREVSRLREDVTSARSNPHPSRQRGQPAVYFTPWLDQEYQALTASNEPAAHRRAQRSLQHKLTRLFVIGAATPAHRP